MSIKYRGRTLRATTFRDATHERGTRERSFKWTSRPRPKLCDGIKEGEQLARAASQDSGLQIRNATLACCELLRPPYRDPPVCSVTYVTKMRASPNFYNPVRANDSEVCLLTTAHFCAASEGAQSTGFREQRRLDLLIPSPIRPLPRRMALIRRVFASTTYIATSSYLYSTTDIVKTYAIVLLSYDVN